LNLKRENDPLSVDLSVKSENPLMAPNFKDDENGLTDFFMVSQ